MLAVRAAGEEGEPSGILCWHADLELHALPTKREGDVRRRSIHRASAGRKSTSNVASPHVEPLTVHDDRVHEIGLFEPVPRGRHLGRQIAGLALDLAIGEADEQVLLVLFNAERARRR